MEDIYLQPGGFYFGNGEVCLHTTLGSCVAVTLWHPVMQWGGMCHYLLPFRNRLENRPLDGTYAVEAMKLFMNELTLRHTRPQDYEARLVGGGHMFGPLRFEDRFDVALMNVEIGRRLLREYGFVIVAEHVGGEGHRQVTMELWSGRVEVKQHPPAFN